MDEPSGRFNKVNKAFMTNSKIRNFSIIAHIDHGKSTLADRIIDISGSLDRRDMTDQLLDTMDLEQERGITIKAQAVRLNYISDNFGEIQLNLIDTPGHVDFNYEVSRSLAACEGAILLVDATQGIQAQTLANVYLALENDLEIIPVINKVDLNSADTDLVLSELDQYFGFSKEETFLVSAKTGEGVKELIEGLIQKIPPPKQTKEENTKGLIFDSIYDPYKGVIIYVKLISGQIKKGETIQFIRSKITSDILETGFFSPDLVQSDYLNSGEVGFIATGLKNLKGIDVGDTITLAGQSTEPLPGYKPINPVVFTGLYPIDGDDYPALRDALEKLKLNDSALIFEPESSKALGFGFRCGFLGLLHMESIEERLEREFEINLIATSPSVKYQVIQRNGEAIYIDNPTLLPEPHNIEKIIEPWVELTIITPTKYIGNIMELVTSRRGKQKNMEYLQSENSMLKDNLTFNSRVLILYEIPLSEILVDFHDRIKSVSQGYASIDYEIIDGRESKMVKLDILVNHEPVDALSIITHTDTSVRKGNLLVDKLKNLIPRQMFQVPIQAAISGRIIARTNVRALRKNVTAKCYGGDITRKRKLLEQQKAGKKRRMKMIGSVEVPQEAFMAVLSLNETKRN